MRRPLALDVHEVFYELSGAIRGMTGHADHIMTDSSIRGRHASYPVAGMGGRIGISVVQANNPDSDGDGLPDAWEIANGLNPNDPVDALKDPDSDGLTNLLRLS